LHCSWWSRTARRRATLTTLGLDIALTAPLCEFVLTVAVVQALLQAGAHELGTLALLATLVPPCAHALLAMQSMASGL
jgi:hypothetical protein